MNDGSARGDAFKTAGVAAGTQGPVFIDGDVAEFPGFSTSAAIELAFNKDGGADTHSGFDEEEVLVFAAEAEVAFCGGHGADAVFKQAGEVEFFFEDGLEGDVLPLRHLSGTGIGEDHSLLRIDDAGVGDADAGDRVAADCRGGDGLADAVEDALQDTDAAVGNTGLDALLMDDVAIHVGNDDVGKEGAKVDADEEAGIAAHLEGDGLATDHGGDGGGFSDELETDEVADDAGDESRAESGSAREVEPRVIAAGMDEAEDRQVAVFGFLLDSIFLRWRCFYRHLSVSRKVTSVGAG